MLKIAIVGCGKIADAHAAQIRRIRGCEIAGVCDREPLMAAQLAERHGIARCTTTLTDLFDGVGPDVVHVTTPPATHYEIARACLERGCHVYVEKPFTLDFREAESLVALAERAGLKLTVGHDDQFSHVARRMRALVATGYLGGEPVHMDSLYCYDLTDASYARALLGDRRHWVRALPGQLLQNIISHGVARIAEFLRADAPQVVALGTTSAALGALGEADLVDELRVLVTGDRGMTASFTFSSQMRPSMHRFHLYGPKNSLILDQDHETLVRLPGRRPKSYAAKFGPPVHAAGQQLREVAANLGTFLARDFHMKSGLKYLIEAFYASITHGTALPIPPREILLTARLMDAIFSELRAARNAGGVAAERMIS